MSPRKIIFFIVTGVLLVAVVIGFFILQKGTKKSTAIPATLKVWITDGTTE